MLRIFGALGTALLAVSSAAVLVLLAAPLSPVVIACLRVGITSVALALLASRSTITVIRACVADPALALRVGLAGLLIGIHFTTWFASLTHTSVVRSVALVATQPLFAGILGHWVGDRAPARLYLGAFVAVAGSVVMASSGTDGWSSGSVLGDVLALTAAASAAAYLVVGRSVRSALPLSGYLAVLNGVAALTLAVVVWSTQARFLEPGAEVGDYLAVVAMGLLPGLVGHGLLNWAVRHVPVHLVSLIILLEPIGASLLAWLFLGQAVRLLEALGAAILLCGVAVGMPRKTVNARSDAAPRTPTS